MAVGPLPRMSPVTIGNLRVDALVDGVSPARRADEMMRNMPEGLVDANRSWLSPSYMEANTDRLILAYQSFVLQLPDAVVLVDAAVGEDGTFSTRPDWQKAKSDWLNHLGQAGLAPEDIDIVFMTHLHVDHTGWLTRLIGGEWVPTFPNARHLVTQTELDFWTTRHGDFAYMAESVPESVEPVKNAGLFEFTSPGDTIAEGLTVVDLAGHSLGMVGLEYREGNKLTAAFNADLMHHPLQMTAPGMSTLFCADPDAAAATRNAKLAEYAEAGTLMFCGHFPGNSAGYAVPDGNGYRFDAYTG